MNPGEQVTEEQGIKQSNPKDAIGSNRCPIGLFPDTAHVAGSLAFAEGALKYGRYNWRAVGVRASIYYDAVQRHLMKWWAGEHKTGDSNLPHLYHALACIAILIDAEVVGKLHDDRPPVADIAQMIDDAEAYVSMLKEKHADRNPHQYTINDEV